MPFGAGARRCIGEQFALNEILCLVTMMLRNFEVIFDTNNKPPTIETTLTMRSKYPINIALIEKSLPEKEKEDRMNLLMNIKKQSKKE